MPAPVFRYYHRFFVKGKDKGEFLGHGLNSRLTWCMMGGGFDLISWNRRLHFYEGIGDEIAIVYREKERKQGFNHANSGVNLSNTVKWKSLTPRDDQIAARTYARKLSHDSFDKMPERKLAALNLNIRRVVQGDKVEDAREVFDKMSERNVDKMPEQNVGKILEQNVELFHKMPSRGIEEWNLKISRLAQGGKIEDAREVFDKMPERNIVSWNSIIAGYGQNGRLEDARKLFDEMPEQNVISWNGMIAGYMQNGRVEEGCELFEAMPQRSAVSWTTMIAGLVQNGRLDDARHLFDKMPQKHVRSWNAMITGYSQHEQSGEAVEFFKEMLQSGMMPNSFTFPSVLRASTNLEAVELGKQIHSCILKRGIESDVFVGSALVTMYSKCGIIESAIQVMNKLPKPDLVLWNAMITGFVQNGRMEEAREFFWNLAQPNVVSWTAMIAGCAQNGHGEEALIYLIEMLKTGVKANESTLTSVLRACTSLAGLEQGKQVHAHIDKTMFENNIFVKNALITMYAKCGSIEDADQVFALMLERDVISWNAIIAGYAQHGHAKEALQLFEQLLLAGTKPNEITFVGVLSACSHAGLVDRGQHYFDSMVQNHCLTAGPEHYACMVDLLGRAGCLHEAENLINNMPLKPDAVIWGSLLSACKIHVNVELGKRAAGHLFELEPGNESTYILLSSIYSAASMWDDARNVRMMMKEKGIRKTPGCSWMDVNNKVQVFVTGDRSHPESEKIYEKLNELAKLMKEAGYMPETNFVPQDVAEDEREQIIY